MAHDRTRNFNDELDAMEPGDHIDAVEMYYGDQIEDYPTQNGQYAYGKTTNEEEDDYSDIVNLCYVVDGVEYETGDDLILALEKVLNVDTFLRYMAVVITLANWDIYPYTGNNYQLFNNPSTGRFEWIPWDLTWGGDPRQPLFELSGPRLLDRCARRLAEALHSLRVETLVVKDASLCMQSHRGQTVER